MQRNQSGRNGFDRQHSGPRQDVRAERRERDRSESARLTLPARSKHPDVAELCDANFRTEVLEADRPVVVDFWSETCRPCRKQEPVIAQLAEELRGRVKVGRLSAFENPRVLQEFHVKGVPHLMVVADGEVILELVGDHSIEQLRVHLRSVGVI